MTDPLEIIKEAAKAGDEQFEYWKEHGELSYRSTQPCICDCSKNYEKVCLYPEKYLNEGRNDKSKST